MFSRLTLIILWSLFSTGLGHATQAGLFSFEYKHLLIPHECGVASPASNSTSKNNRYEMPVSSDITEISNLVKNGSAFVYPTDYKTLDEINTLLNLEDMARAKQIGCIWQNNNVVQNAKDIKDTGRFMIVEGRVYDVYESYENIYLNFDQDWKTDFTVRIPKKDKDFKNIDLNSYENKMVQVRGFVEFYNGPSLTLEHPILLREIK